VPAHTKLRRMSKNTLGPLLLAVVLAALMAPGLASAAPSGPYKGQATAMDGSFKYGKVTFSVIGKTIRNLRIRGVTTSGCGGFKDVIVPKLTIKGSRFSGTYKPVAGIDDKITVSGSFSGSSVKATFKEGPLCVNRGRFTAKHA